MNAQQEARVNMFYATAQVLEDNNGIWSGTPAMVTLKTEFDANVGSIEAALAIQVKDITGYAKAKAASLEKLVSKTLQVAGAAMAYAEATKNPGLSEEMNISASELRNYRDAVVAQRCQGVHSAATTNLAALAGYGVVAADLTELQADIDAFLALTLSRIDPQAETERYRAQVLASKGRTLDERARALRVGALQAPRGEAPRDPHGHPREEADRQGPRGEAQEGALQDR